jgi:hypothetical protein
MNTLDTLIGRLESGCVHSAAEGNYGCPEAQKIAASLKGLLKSLTESRAEVRGLRDRIVSASHTEAVALISASAEIPLSFSPTDIRWVAEAVAFGEDSAALIRKINNSNKYGTLESELNKE